MIKVIALCGSTRSGSFNKKVLNQAIVGVKDSGAQVTVINLRDYPLPLYDGDLEEIDGIPENAMKLKKIFLDHQALLFALPEYNSSLSGVFKNAIDWISRPIPNEIELACFAGKVCALMSASPGSLGGIRGLVHARSMLENINVMVIPKQVCVRHALDAFTPDGMIKDEKIRFSIIRLGANLVEVARKMNLNKVAA
jgi:NAD(P)H-dependent FMN reductase